MRHGENGLDKKKPGERGHATLVELCKSLTLEVFEQLRPKIESKARLRLSRERNVYDAAKDVVSEVFLAMMEKIHAWKPDGSGSLFDMRLSEFERDPQEARAKAQNRIVTWLQLVAKNKISDEFRRKSKTTSESDLCPAEDEAGYEVVNPFYSTPALQPGPETLVRIKRDMQKISDYMNGLSKEEQELLDFKFRDGMTHKEIAELLSKPEGTVKTQFHRIMDRFRDRVNLNYDVHYIDDASGRLQ
jgi:RNA polymerase sigma factor (sigma-70 family)